MAYEAIAIICGIAQKRRFDGSLTADRYWRQSVAWERPLVTMAFRHCSAFSEFSPCLNPQTEQHIDPKSHEVFQVISDDICFLEKKAHGVGKTNDSPSSLT
jgi:hypothetical protein